MVKPISPEDIPHQKLKDLPDEVIMCWNSLIAKNFTNGSSIIKLKDARKAICDVTNMDGTEIRQNGYLDIEEIYRAEGWSIKYDQPAYNETYDAYYEFKKK